MSGMNLNVPVACERRNIVTGTAVLRSSSSTDPAQTISVTQNQVSSEKKVSSKIEDDVSSISIPEDQDGCNPDLNMRY